MIISDFNRRIITFLLTTYLLSWVLLAVFHWSGGVWGSRAAIVIGLSYSSFPFISTLLIHKFLWNKPLELSLGKIKPSIGWLLYALIIPAILTLLCIVLLMMYPRTKVNTQQITFIYPLLPIIGTETTLYIIHFLSDYSTLIVNLLGASFLSFTWFGLIGYWEESGWRGFFFRHILEKLGFWTSAWVSGLAYGIWVFPLFYANSGSYMIGLYAILLAILQAPVLCFLRLQSRSVTPVAIMHGAFLAFSSFDRMFMDDTRGISFFFTVYLSGLCVINLGVLLLKMNTNEVLETLPDSGFNRTLPRTPTLKAQDSTQK